MTDDTALRMFAVTGEHEACDEIWWRTDGEYAPVTFFVGCNDLFFWACADAEAITDENIDIFEQSYRDAANATDDGDLYGHLLFCCRARGMRPQKPYYAHFPDELHPLLDGCGPERDQ